MYVEGDPGEGEKDVAKMSKYKKRSTNELNPLCEKTLWKLSPMAAAAAANAGTYVCYVLV